MSLEFATEFCLDNENNELKIKKYSLKRFLCISSVYISLQIFYINGVDSFFSPLLVQFLSPSQPQAPPHPRRPQCAQNSDTKFIFLVRARK